tara:strand:- start:320 stop:532 length:213 start_codon:yes stop_codon:yes gene_type:complete
MSKDWPLLRILKDFKDYKDVNYTKGNKKPVHKPIGLIFNRNKEQRNLCLKTPLVREEQARNKQGERNEAI